MIHDISCQIQACDDGFETAGSFNTAGKLWPGARMEEAMYRIMRRVAGLNELGTTSGGRSRKVD